MWLPNKNASYRSLKLLPTFINTKLPSGLLEPRGLLFVI